MSRFVRSATIVAFAVFASACSINLQHDLNEDDANDIYVLLRKSGIDATKIKEGEGKDARFVISVPKADVAAAAELLREHSLPRPKSAGLGIFKETKGMIPTQTEERAMFIEALGGEVSNALNRIPGVLEARTIVQLPETSDLTQPEKEPPTTASVLIKYMEVEGKPPITPDEIRMFVAGAIPKLQKDNVAIIMTQAKFVQEAASGPRMKSIFGVNVEESSAGTFKAIIGVFALLIIVMAGLTGFMVVRKPAASSARPTRSKPAQEG